MGFSQFKDNNLARQCDKIVNKMTDIRNNQVPVIKNKKYRDIIDKKMLSLQKEINKINHEENV